MAIRPIRIFPDSLLSKPSETITDFGEPLKALLKDLTDTLYHSPGVGLAAPQIGVLQRVSVIDIHRNFSKTSSSSSRSDTMVLVNPSVIKGEGEQIPREGCLSVPDWLAHVRRYKKIVVEAFDVEGKKKLITAEDFEALALQHEIDHLNGVLFLDRIVDLKTDLFRRKTYRKTN